MNSLKKIIEKKENLLSVYFTAGFPALNDTTRILNSLEKNGVDLIEIGIPFSDPLADGPIIQQSSEQALKNGMNVKLLFEQLKQTDLKNFSAGILLMSYLNPVLQYGMENFCKDAAEAGVRGLIIPDLPLSIYSEEYKSVFGKYDLQPVFLITPQTSEARIRLIDASSEAFIYMVSSSSTTGIKQGISQEQEIYFERIRKMNLKNPLMIGFGISNAAAFSKACEYAHGGIIGSAFIKAIDTSSRLEEDIGKFISEITFPALLNTDLEIRKHS